MFTSFVMSDVRENVNNISIIDSKPLTPIEKIDSYKRILNNCENLSTNDKHVIELLLLDAEKEFTLIEDSIQGEQYLRDANLLLRECTLKEPEEPESSIFDLPIFNSNLLTLLGLVSTVVFGLLALRKKEKMNENN